MAIIAVLCPIMLGSGTEKAELQAQQPECIHDGDSCHAGECKVWESSRWVCEPETYSVVIYPAKCLKDQEITPETRLEMRLDANQKPDKASARLIGAKITYFPDCIQARVEIRKRNVNY